MKDVDALNRGPFAPVLKYYLAATIAIRERELICNKEAYDEEIFQNVMAKGKYNLKTVRDWSITNEDKLKASIMLTDIGTAVRANNINIIHNIIKKSHPIASKTQKSSEHQTSATHNKNPENHKPENHKPEKTCQITETQKIAAPHTSIANAITCKSVKPVISLESYDMSTSKHNPPFKESSLPFRSRCIFNTQIASSIRNPTRCNMNPKPKAQQSFTHPHSNIDIDQNLMQSSARTDLEKTFSNAVTAINSVHRDLSTTHFDIVASKSLSSSTICAPCISTINPAPAVDICIRKTIVTWVSLNSSVPSFSYHLQNLCFPNIDLSIFQPDRSIYNLVKHLIPEATYILRDCNHFWTTILTDASPPFASTKLHDAPYSSADDIPLACTNYTIDGIDDHIHDDQWISCFHSNALPFTIFQRLTRFKSLREKRKLKTFVLTLRYFDKALPELQTLQNSISDYMNEWNLETHCIESPHFGDPIQCKRFVILGTHRNEWSEASNPFQNIPTIHSAPAYSTALRTYTDLPAFSIPQNMVTASSAQEDSKISTKDQYQPLVLETVQLKQTSGCIETLCPSRPAKEIRDILSINLNQLALFATPYSAAAKKFRRLVLPEEYASLYLTDYPSNFQRIALSFVSTDVNTFISVITSCQPSASFKALAEHTYSNMLLGKREESSEVPANIIRCHLIQSLPTNSEWSEAYAEDHDTNYIIARLRQSTAAWEEKEIRKVHKNYWEAALRNNSFKFEQNRLTICKLIGSTHRYLSLIVVPPALRRAVFNAYHASGVGAHKGKFKTLLAIRMRFFWPVMRKDIIAWVDGCPDCIPARMKKRESTGLVHSWPITTPFAIISVDFWKPGTTTNPRGFNGLLNAMCDMTQFIVSVPIKRSDSAYIARMFMESVLLKFGICAMVVVDDGSEYRKTFEQMCKALSLRFHAVAKRNHKAVGVERYHKFLNHAQTIVTEQRGTSESFVECGMTTAYAWNASFIDGTDIIRSIPRALKFPLDIVESAIPTLTDDPRAAVIRYMQYLGNDVRFSRSLLQWLIHDRRERHRERVNETRKNITYKAGDVVMGRVAVMSKASTGKVSKLVYQSRGPFIIIKNTRHSTYIVKRFGNTGTTPTFKFMTEDLYLLPKQVLPCSQMDTTDMRYLNTDHAPINIHSQEHLT